MGWLAGLTLEDEERADLDLSRVVCEYVDVFQMSYLDYLHIGMLSIRGRIVGFRLQDMDFMVGAALTME